ncbi:phage tail protein [Erythrobacter sp. THAF29]|uniref:phage tail protein n=1 Tax=Erythrobacter sp. THAF29 TaxID=2587851 RepID=UPI0012687A08|nr:phage tail protein [Erythrobacter sp. THAF29]QFT76148.1 hypothetical protein FIU90_01200 [Erythrobacter sp. THAF29]
MATVLFTVVGTAFGGPLGGAIGGLLGRQVDQSIFGSGAREGPRLKELSVTTSSYGQPIPRIFGRMRVAGTVIWSTELSEKSETQGGKGRPKNTTYSYSASFAVALSSTPIERIGRIWADGELLRGSEGDLKVEGEMRLYRGLGDDPVDPIIAAEKGSDAVAFRDCAYVLFEDLQLADYGNRIPALTFEVFAEEAPRVTLNALAPSADVDAGNAEIEYARGFADEGGSISSTLAALDRVFPLTCRVAQDGLKLGIRKALPQNIPTLSRQLSSRDSGDANERHRQRGQAEAREPLALRYYDEGRDYQPGVQRANGVRSEGREIMIDLPAVLNASGAKQLANDNAHRTRWRSQRLKWRVGEIDPSIVAGSVVKIPDGPGFWLVRSWEWLSEGIELELERLPPELGSTTGGDSGAANSPLDLSVAQTTLAAIEIPHEGSGDVDKPNLFAAAAGTSENWNGASLFAEQNSSLVPIGPSGSRSAVHGTLAVPLGVSACHLFEPNAKVEVAIAGPVSALMEADINGIANGANRLCVGAEIIQFAGATETAPGRWELTGLLRGRGGTEDAAQVVHPAGTAVVLIDDRLTGLDPTQINTEATTRIAAVGRGDATPVFAQLDNAGLSRRPPTPVHPRLSVSSDESWQLFWTRRARGQWRWESLLEPPLIEQQEAYAVGFGPVDSPHRTWVVNEASLALGVQERADLLAAHGPGPIWVKQVGTFVNSPPLHLANID